MEDSVLINTRDFLKRLRLFEKVSVGFSLNNSEFLTEYGKGFLNGAEFVLNLINENKIDKENSQEEKEEISVVGELKEIKELLRIIASNTERLKESCYSSVEDIIDRIINSTSMEINLKKKSNFDDESCLECMNDIVQSMLKKYEEQ